METEEPVRKGVMKGEEEHYREHPEMMEGGEEERPLTKEQ